MLPISSCSAFIVHYEFFAEQIVLIFIRKSITYCVIVLEVGVKIDLDGACLFEAETSSSLAAHLIDQYINLLSY